MVSCFVIVRSCRSSWAHRRRLQNASQSAPATAAPEEPVFSTWVGAGNQLKYAFRAPDPSLSPAPAAFATTPLMGISPMTTVTMTNDSPVVMGATTMTISGAHADDFLLLRDSCTGDVGSDCEIKLRFAPNAAGARSATLTVAS